MELSIGHFFEKPVTKRTKIKLTMPLEWEKMHVHDFYRALKFPAVFSLLFHTEKTTKNQNHVKIVHMQVVLIFCPFYYRFVCEKLYQRSS